MATSLRRALRATRLPLVLRATRLPFPDAGALISILAGRGMMRIEY